MRGSMMGALPSMLQNVACIHECFEGPYSTPSEETRQRCHYAATTYVAVAVTSEEVWCFLCKGCTHLVTSWVQRGSLIVLEWLHDLLTSFLHAWLCLSDLEEARSTCPCLCDLNALENS